MHSYFTTGIDEAGYGPLLGPLVVGAATIHTTDPLDPDAAWDRLAPVVSRKRSKTQIAVADSKALHKSKTGDLSALELGVLSFVTAERGDLPPTFRSLMHHLTGGALQYLNDYPWYRDRDIDLPADVNAIELAGQTRKLGRALENAEMRVAELRACPIDVVDFNRGVAETNSKGEVNARAIGQFILSAWRTPDRRHCRVMSDRLGGRTRYAPFLYELLPEGKLVIERQNPEEQIYRVTHRASRRNFQVMFRKECESTSFPTALASMIAKYIRELHMRLFNSWWQQKTDAELARTAGYYKDARRFLSEIEPWIDRLDVPREKLVRTR